MRLEYDGLRLILPSDKDWGGGAVVVVQVPIELCLLDTSDLYQYA
jgi:hypothetical protein